MTDLVWETEYNGSKFHLFVQPIPSTGIPMSLCGVAMREEVSKVETWTVDTPNPNLQNGWTECKTCRKKLDKLQSIAKGVGHAR